MFTKRQALMFHAMQHLTPRERRSLLTSANTDIIKALVELVHNTLHGNVPLTPKQIHQLHKYKQTLRALSRRSLSLEQKRHLLAKQQRGGFLPFLLPIVTSAVSGLLQGIVNNNNK